MFGTMKMVKDIVSRLGLSLLSHGWVQLSCVELGCYLGGVQGSYL